MKDKKFNDEVELGWVIIHGGVFQSGHQGPGKTVQLTEAEAHEIDPTINKDGVGTTLISEKVHAKLTAGEKAKADKIAELEADEKKPKADHKK